jgi:hypothetical protein
MSAPPLTRIRFFSAVLWRRTKGLIFLVLLSVPAFAQGTSLVDLNDGPLNSDANNSAPTGSTLSTTGAIERSPIASSPLPEAPSEHRFLDTENRALFTTVAVLSATDFALTRSILQNGGKELNPVTRFFSGSTAGLAVNFAGETVGVIGLSYLFHKTGHHRLERATPMLDIGASAFAVIYDLNHR